VEFKEPVEKAPESTQITINVPVSGFTIPHKHVYFRVKVVDPYIGVKVSLQATAAANESSSSSSSSPTRAATTTRTGTAPSAQFFLSKKNQFVSRSNFEVFGTSLQKEPITLEPLGTPGGSSSRGRHSWYYVSIFSEERVKFVLNVSEDAKEGRQERRGWGRSRSNSPRSSRSPSPGRRLGGLSLSKRGKCDDVDDDDVDAAWGAHTESDANTSDKKSKAGAKVAGKAAGKGGSDDAEEKADEIRRRRLAALSRYAARSTPKPSKEDS